MHVNWIIYSFKKRCACAFKQCRAPLTIIRAPKLWLPDLSQIVWLMLLNVPDLLLQKTAKKEVARSGGQGGKVNRRVFP